MPYLTKKIGKDWNLKEASNFFSYGREGDGRGGLIVGNKKKVFSAIGKNGTRKCIASVLAHFFRSLHISVHIS